MNKTKCRHQLFLVLFLAILTVSSAVAGDLYRITDSAAVATARAAVEGAQIDILPSAFHEAALDVELLDGSRFRVNRTDLEIRGDDNFTWRGRFAAEEGQDGGRAILTWQHGTLVGVMWTPRGLYQIVPTPHGQHLERVDTAQFEGCSVEEAPQTASQTAPQDRFASLPSPPETLGGTIEIDLMSFYTPEARDSAGGELQIATAIQNAVDQANTAFLDSDMTARFRLVYTALSSRSDSGSSSSDLSWLRGDAEVGALRDRYGVDMVSLIIEDGGCGVAYVMRNPGSSFAGSAFQISSRSCMVGNLTFAHEHGHNMGFEHDPANGTSPGNASYDWSFGHFVNGSYRTVMSYSNQCTSGCGRVPHFSNPDVTHNSAPTGIADARDNHRSGNLTAPIVAAFREAPIFTGAFHSGDLSAWSSASP